MARNFDLVESMEKCHGSLIWQGWAFIIIWYIILNNRLSILPPGNIESYEIHSIQTDLSPAQTPMTEGWGQDRWNTGIGLGPLWQVLLTPHYIVQIEIAIEIEFMYW